MKLKLSDIKKLREEQGLTFVSFGEDEHVREILFEGRHNTSAGPIQPSADTRDVSGLEEERGRVPSGDISRLPREDNLAEFADGMFEQGRQHVLDKMTPEMRQQWEAIEESDLRFHSA